MRYEKLYLSYLQNVSKKKKINKPSKMMIKVRTNFNKTSAAFFSTSTSRPPVFSPQKNSSSVSPRYSFSAEFSSLRPAAVSSSPSSRPPLPPPRSPSSPTGDYEGASAAAYPVGSPPFSASDASSPLGFSTLSSSLLSSLSSLPSFPSSTLLSSLSSFSSSVSSTSPSTPSPPAAAPLNQQSKIEALRQNAYDDTSDDRFAVNYQQEEQKLREKDTQNAKFVEEIIQNNLPFKVQVLPNMEDTYTYIRSTIDTLSPRMGAWQTYTPFVYKLKQRRGILDQHSDFSSFASKEETFYAHNHPLFQHIQHMQQTNEKNVSQNAREKNNNNNYYNNEHNTHDDECIAAQNEVCSENSSSGNLVGTSPSDFSSGLSSSSPFLAETSEPHFSDGGFPSSLASSSPLSDIPPLSPSSSPPPPPSSPRSPLSPPSSVSAAIPHLSSPLTPLSPSLPPVSPVSPPSSLSSTAAASFTPPLSASFSSSPLSRPIPGVLSASRPPLPPPPPSPLPPASSSFTLGPSSPLSEVSFSPFTAADMTSVFLAPSVSPPSSSVSDAFGFSLPSADSSIPPPPSLSSLSSPSELLLNQQQRVAQVIQEQEEKQQKKKKEEEDLKSFPDFSHHISSFSTSSSSDFYSDASPPSVSLSSSTSSPPLYSSSLSSGVVQQNERKEVSIPDTQIKRVAHFGGLLLSVAVGTAVEATKRIRNNASLGGMRSLILNEQNSETFKNSLAKMRGAALKLGQMLSLHEKHLPPLLRDALNSVRNSAYVMPNKQLHQILAEEWGADWKKHFMRFDEKAFAAASIGQVHEAVLLNGEKVAVKVQYPGVRESISSDIKNILFLSKYFKIFPSKMFIDVLCKQMQNELSAECDYTNEANFYALFRELLKKDRRVYIPRVVRNLSTGRVLTTEFIHGMTMEEVICGESQATRNIVGAKLLEICLKELFVFKIMNTDPNPSNFLFMKKQKQIALIDFGAGVNYDTKFVDMYLKLVHAAALKDRDSLLYYSQLLGFLTGEENEAMKNAHADSAVKIGEPFMEKGEYDFGATTIVEHLISSSSVMLQNRLVPPPPQIYSLHRKLAGCYLICISLRAKINAHDLFFKIYNEYKFTYSNEDYLKEKQK